RRLIGALCQCVLDQHDKKPIKIPAAGEHVWRLFKELDRARAGTGFGINPIAWQEIDSWARLRKLNLSQWEIDALISPACSSRRRVRR
ncbi:hypothetical protein ACC717_37345, partial [Rhizobium ruizarguesonis]